MVILRATHPPATATTLIISLGTLTKPWQLLVLMLAVVLLTTQALIINRLAGINYPLWRSQPAHITEHSPFLPHLKGRASRQPQRHEVGSVAVPK